MSSPAGDGPGPATGGKEQEPLVLPSPIRVGSLCSGMKTEHWSLDLLRWDFEEVFWCEPDETARKFVEANMSSKVRGFRDLMGREFQENAPPCDLLVAGFPCQPFSIQGKGHGLEDEAGRGIIIVGILRYVKKHMPQLVLLENVEGLVSRHRSVLDNVLTVLRGMEDTNGNTYSVSWRVLDSHTHGNVPCRRLRVYIVAIKNCGVRHVRMSWPGPVPKPGLAKICDGDAKLSTYVNYPTPPSATASRNIRAALDKVRKVAEQESKQPTEYPIIVDTAGSQLNMGWNVAPCLTKARGGALAFWSLQHGRPLTISELCRLQGLSSSDMHIPISANQMGGLLGNGFTCTVVTRVIAAAIDAAANS